MRIIKDNGFYETDNYIEGNNKYFRGYCIKYLEHRAKIERMSYSFLFERRIL